MFLWAPMDLQKLNVNIYLVLPSMTCVFADLYIHLPFGLLFLLSTVGGLLICYQWLADAYVDNTLVACYKLKTCLLSAEQQRVITNSCYLITFANNFVLQTYTIRLV